MHYPEGGAGNQFFSSREARRDAYLVSASDERQRSERNWPSALWVAAKIGPYFVAALNGGPATAFGLRLLWPDFLSQRRPPQ
jgi:hypothetical protein